MTIEFDRLCAESVPVPAFVRAAQKAAASLILGKGTEKDLDHLLLLFRTAETLLKKGSLQESAEKLRLYEGACAAFVMARGRPFDHKTCAYPVREGGVKQARLEEAY